MDKTESISEDQKAMARFAKATPSHHLKELKDVGLIQGEIEGPKIKYCLNQENWKVALSLFSSLMNSKQNL